jgi:hypothetical protein
MKNNRITKSIITFICVCFSFHSQAQYDTLFMQNGKVEAATVLRVSNENISFKFKDEQAERSISHYALSKIVFHSGRIEKQSKRHEILSDTSWKDVKVLRHFSETEGLNHIGEISAHTAFINLHTSKSGEKAAKRKLLKKAAELRCPFIFITMEKEILYGQIKFWGVSQYKIKAIAYQY